MRIIQVITSFELGGAERVAIDISKSQSLKYKYTLFEVVKSDSKFSQEIKSELKNYNIRYYCSPFKNKKIALCLFWTWFIWKYIYLKPNIIHVHTEIPDLALWVFRKISWIIFWIRPKYVRTIHNTNLWTSWNKIGKVVEKYYKRNKCNIAISKSVQKSYVESYGGIYPPIIYNGTCEAKQKRFHDIKTNKINILFAGRLEYQKGVDELISVIKALKDDNRFYFHIIGDGSMKEKLLEAIKNIDNATLYSKIYGLSSYLSSFDYLFMPSNFEGLALMPIEASMAKLPSIINSCPGLEDTLPQDWPLKVTTNNINDYIKIFKEDIFKLDYTTLQETAYKYAKQKFSLETMQHKYEELYSNKVK